MRFMRKCITKTTSFLLIIALIFACFTGCGNSSENNVTGTQAAKLLLANERLDSNVLSNGLNTLLGNTQNNTVSHGFTSDFILGSFGKMNLPFLNQIGTFNKSGNNYEWSNFGDYSNINSFFESYIISMEGTVQQVIQLIDHAKTYISVTDVWVGDRTSAQMLSVSETSDTLFEYHEYGYRICKRYTNSEAQNVYETYSKSDETVLKTLCIPDQRYEFTLTYAGGDGLYLIMENSRGYWNMLCLSDVGHGSNITNIMTSSGVSYVFDYYMSNSGTSPEYSILKLLTADRNCDLMSIYGNSVTIYPSGFTGIDRLRVTAEESDVIHGSGDSHTALIREMDGMYSTNAASATVILSNGKEIKPEDTFMDEIIRYQHGAVHHVVEGYHAQLDFMVEGTTTTEVLNNMATFLKANGLNCKVNLDTILSNAPKGEIFLNQFLDSYNWNGYIINSGANLTAAYQAEIAKYAPYEAMYEAVKDNELKSYNEIQQADNLNDLKFAEIDTASLGNNISYENNIITIDSLTFTISDLTLFEANTLYTIQLGYATPITSDDGNITYDPCSVYPFTSENMVYTSYSGEDTFSIQQTATYNNYGILSPGTYHVVAYVTTSEGIRVSELFPLVFSSDVSATENLPLVNLTLSTNENKNLVAKYEYNNDIAVEIENEKDSYTYQEIYQLLINNVISHGELTDTTLEMATDEELTQWKALSGSETLSDCVVRIKYVKNNTEAHIYVAL